jgi:hypothetical protein
MQAVACGCALKAAHPDHIAQLATIQRLSLIGSSPARDTEPRSKNKSNPNAGPQSGAKGRRHKYQPSNNIRAHADVRAVAFTAHRCTQVELYQP